MLLRSGSSRNGALVETALAVDLPRAVGDRVQLQQVVMNPVLNGAEAMSAVDDRPRRLVIRSDVDDAGRIRVRVEDAGHGISTDALRQVFDAFHTTKPDGMGIGLAISRTIVEAHHGEIWAARNDGPGTTFTFVVPAAPPAML